MVAVGTKQLLHLVLCWSNCTSRHLVQICSAPCMHSYFFFHKLRENHSRLYMHQHAPTGTGSSFHASMNVLNRHKQHSQHYEPWLVASHMRTPPCRQNHLPTPPQTTCKPPRGTSCTCACHHPSPRGIQGMKHCCVRLFPKYIVQSQLRSTRGFKGINASWSAHVHQILVFESSKMQR